MIDEELDRMIRNQNKAFCEGAKPMNREDDSTFNKWAWLQQNYVTCNLCHQPVPEISKATEPPYRYHPACRPEAVAKREAAKEARRENTKVE